MRFGIIFVMRHASNIQFGTIYGLDVSRSLFTNGIRFFSSSCTPELCDKDCPTKNCLARCIASRRPSFPATAQQLQARITRIIVTGSRKNFDSVIPPHSSRQTDLRESPKSSIEKSVERARKSPLSIHRSSRGARACTPIRGEG